MLNVDGALWLCAFEIIFEDDDGYVNKRGSDYGLYYEPETGRMHLIQYDGNESMGTGQWSVFYRADDAAVPVMCRLMAIPKYRQRYLAHVRTILNTHFTEETLSAKIDAYRALIETEVKADTKKLYANQAFDTGVPALKTFVQSRRKLLLSDPEVSRQGPRSRQSSKEVTETESGQSVLVTARLSEAVAVDNVQLFVAAGSFRPLCAYVHGRSGFAERGRGGGTGFRGGSAGLSGGNRRPVLRPGGCGRRGWHPGFQSRRRRA